MTKPIIFIDGEAGTTGLGIRQRLDAADFAEVRSIDPDKRKDESARAAMMEDSDLVILCLPDDAAKEAVALAASLGNKAPRLLDASTAHRVAEGWVYGFPEMEAGQPKLIRDAARVSNPGCYPTGAIALLRPLVEEGLLPADAHVTVNAVSGYSGGGKQMIEQYEGGKHPKFDLYGMSMEHKHVPELHLFSKLARRPIFIPSVGDYRQGMIVSIPLFADQLTGKPGGKDVTAVLARRYAGSETISVNSDLPARLEPEALNDTNKMELRVYANDRLGQMVLMARLDNLGKGASGAAVQNARLMLGV